MARRWRRHQEGALAHRQISTGRNDIEIVRFDQHAVSRLPHAERRVARQQLHHHALVAWVEVLDQDERHAAPGRNRLYQLLASLKTAGGGADADNRESRSVVV
jgi:hypothetical protein